MRDGPEEWQAIKSLLRDAAAADAEHGVQPFLADRVMRRIAAEKRGQSSKSEADLWEWLAVVFRPVAAICLVLVIVLAAHNLYLSSQFEARQSAVEAVFAIPEISTAVIFDYDLAAQQEPEQR